jgi:hypothetical protein
VPLDDTPLDTDWDDFHLLWEDLARFARENPNHTFISADDPGVNYSPTRVGRIGWSAFLVAPPGEDEKAKCWTITLPNLKRTVRDEMEEVLFTSAPGRRLVLQRMQERQREPPSRPTRFEREPPL